MKTEIEDHANNNLTIPQVVNRLGMVFFLLFFNLGITIFVFLLTGMMLFSQIPVSYTHLDVYKRQMPKYLLKMQNLIFRIMPCSAFEKMGFQKTDFILSLIHI